MLAQVLDELIVHCRELIDFGAGDGKVMVASLAKGASRAHGYELLANGEHQFVLNTVLEKIGGHSWSKRHNPDDSEHLKVGLTIQTTVST